MDISEAQKQVLQWASDADSYDKVGFVKLFADTLGKLEIHHLKNIFAAKLKTAERRKREWVGPTAEEGAEKKRKVLEESEDPAAIPSAPVVPLPRSNLPRWGKLPVAWWDTWDCSDCLLGYDTEMVSVKKLTGSEKGRGAKIAVVGKNYETVYATSIYHAAGSYIVNPKTIKVNGIKHRDLIDGIPMTEVTKKMEQLLAGNLTVVCDGVKDFTCIDLTFADYDTFDLQTYYKRKHEDQNDNYGMSLRDIYFLEFRQDFQGASMHSAEEDAKATIKIFREGYVPRNAEKLTRDDKWQFVEFDDSVKLKRMDAQGKFFCNTDKVFKDYNYCECHCKSCKKLFSEEMKSGVWPKKNI